MFSEKQPDLNWDNPKVRDAVFDMMNWWCEKGIDGFRMDVISMISKAEGLPDGEEKGGLYGDWGPYVCNGPHVHEYLQEMNRKVLSRYDLLTVGETSGVTVEEAKKYASLSGKELNMVFQFEHMDLDGGALGKWNDRKIRLSALKQVMSKWQNELYGVAWNSLFWCNHDQPRIVSRLGNDSQKYREKSAKMLATCLHMLQGTPYIYQGEELGMTNVPFPDASALRDIESINALKENTEKGLADYETMFRYIRYKGRDNARTPMQWDDSAQAGFTAGTPWIMVNPNYTEINAKEQRQREDSVFHYYQKLIRLRKEHDIIVYGSYIVHMPEDESVYLYERILEGEKLLVICNFTDAEAAFELPEGWNGREEVLITNEKEERSLENRKLCPYEAVVLRKSE